MTNRIRLYRDTIAPCKDCLDRHQGCHSTCKKYSDWRNKMNEEHDSKLANSMKYCDANRFLIGQNIKGKAEKRRKMNK